MSYDLYFWNQLQPDSDPAIILNSIVAGDFRGLVPLNVCAAVSEVLAAFPGAERTDRAEHSHVIWDNPVGGGCFQLTWTPFTLCFECHSLNNEVLNRLIDIGLATGACLYDPQVNQRFRNDGPPEVLRTSSTFNAMTALVDETEWARCPGCRRRFKITDGSAFRDGVHVKCGQRLLLERSARGNAT